MGKYVLAWFPMVVIAITNGGLRQAWYGKHLGELQAHQVSTLTAVILLVANSNFSRKNSSLSRLATGDELPYSMSP